MVNESASTTPRTVAVIAIDPSGTIILWTDGAAQLLGHSAEGALGQDVTMIVPPEFREQHRAGLQRAMAGGADRAEPTPFDLPVLRADGGVEEFSALLTILETPTTRPAGAIVVMQRRVTEN